MRLQGHGRGWGDAEEFAASLRQIIDRETVLANRGQAIEEPAGLLSWNAKPRPPLRPAGKPLRPLHEVYHQRVLPSRERHRRTW